MRTTILEESHSRLNPWGLSIRECASLNAMLNADSAHDAALNLNCTRLTLKTHLRSAAEKMGRTEGDVRLWTDWWSFLHGLSSAKKASVRVAALLMPPALKPVSQFLG